MRGSSLHDAAFFDLADQIAILIEPRRSDQPAVELDAQGPYNGHTAPHNAVWHGHVDAVAELIQAKARRGPRSHAGPTPLGLAPLYGYGQIIAMLEQEVPAAEQ